MYYNYFQILPIADKNPKKSKIYHDSDHTNYWKFLFVVDSSWLDPITGMYNDLNCSLDSQLLPLENCQDWIHGWSFTEKCHPYHYQVSLLQFSYSTIWNRWMIFATQFHEIFQHLTTSRNSLFKNYLKFEEDFVTSQTFSSDEKVFDEGVTLYDFQFLFLSLALIRRLWLSCMTAWILCNIETFSY